MVGKMWTTMPRSGRQWFDNDHFRTWLCLRLGLVRAPSGSTCQIVKKDGDKCLHTITNPCVHPHLCGKGPARLRPHRGVMEAAEKIFRRSGAATDLERAIPALYRVTEDGKVTEATLDVVVISPGNFSSFPIDVTIRCPHGIRNERGQSLSANRTAVAGKDGELERLLRYGEQVCPLSLETYGRMGYGSMASMRALTASIASSKSHYGIFRSGGHMLAALRLEVELALAFNIADITILALGHGSGTSAQGRRD